ncbi:hypothetical protein M1D80_11870 [Phyllobacteriaceae bacterium JZ32]
MSDEFDPTRVAKPKKAQTQTGRRAIRAIFVDALSKLEEAQRLTFAPDPNEPRADPNDPEHLIRPGKWDGYPDNAMPPYCPFRVVGRDIDGTVYCVTATGHLRAVTRFDDITLADLAAPLTNDAMHAWPAWSKEKREVDELTGETKVIPPRVVRLETKTAARAIINEAARLPDFNPHDQHRGRGGWVNKHNDFVWHSGKYLWRSENKRLIAAAPTMYDGFLYTRQRPSIEPWQEAVSAEESPARRIVEDLRTWKWARPYLDPVLTLGWLVTALMGGALKARPIIFTTGGAGVGKSTLHELIKNVLTGAVFSSVDTTAAGIYQQVKQDSLPVMIDELESKANSMKAQSVIELARVAYSGGDISRGGQDHEGTLFTMRASFFFSAINPPPMKSQDKTRMAVMNLAALDRTDGIRRNIVVNQETDGRMILRQILDGWKRFNEELMPFYWGILHEQGLDSRAIDTFGTLLAAAELVIGADAMEQIGLPVAEPAALGEMIGAATALERSERIDNWHACLSHLLQSTIDAWKGGEKLTIGGVCEQLTDRDKPLDIIYARERLACANLGVRPAGDPSNGYCLAVPKDGPMLKKIFAGEDWHNSVWWDALQQAPRHIVIRDAGNKQKIKINGDTKHCLLIDLQAFEDYCNEIGKEKE